MSGAGGSQWWIAVLALAVPVGILTWAYEGGKQRRTFGTVTSSGAVMGDWVMDVDRCQTGMEKGFYGAQLYSSKNPKLAVWMVEDPLKGTVASINSTSGGDAVNMDRRVCTVLKGETHDEHPGASMRYGYPFIAGEYDLDCVVEGSHVRGHVEFTGCR